MTDKHDASANDAGQSIVATNPEKPLDKTQQTKRKVGRPRTAYKPEHCETVIELGKTGATVTMMARACNVDVGLIYDWINPASPYYEVEFYHAFARAKTESQAWMEAEGLKSLHSRDWQGSTYMWMMNNRFSKDYSARPELGQGAIAIQINLGDKAQGESDLL